MMFSYSLDGMDYTGSCADREEAMEEGKEAAQAEGQNYFYIGKNIEPHISVDGDRVIEQVTDTEDFYTEHAEGWPGATSEQVKDLDAILTATFNEWLSKYNLKPTFWTVQNSERIEFN